MARLYQRYRETIASGSQDFTVSPGYHYSLFVGAFDAGTVTLEAVAVSREDVEYTCALLGGDVTTDGKSAELLATTDTFRITLADGAEDVYIELAVMKAVSNPENSV